MRSINLFVVLLLSGCGLKPLFIKPDPIDVHESSTCRTECSACDEKNPVSVTSNPDTAIDALKAEHLLRQICEQHGKACAVSKQACVEAIDRGKTAGAIK